MSLGWRIRVISMICMASQLGMLAEARAFESSEAECTQVPIDPMQAILGDLQAGMAKLAPPDPAIQLEKAAASLEARLASAKPIDQERLSKAKAKVTKWLLDLIRFYEKRPARDEVLKAAKLIYARFLTLFDDMSASGRIRELNANVAASLGVERYFCTEGKTPKTCKHMYGFYVPLAHQVYLDRTMNDEQLARALFHELTHAYQYTYRFPLDVQALSAVEGKDSKNKIDLQNFYYELQANHYTIRADAGPKWDEKMSGMGAVGTIGNVAKAILKVPAGILGVFIHMSMTKKPVDRDDWDTLFGGPTDILPKMESLDEGVIGAEYNTRNLSMLLLNPIVVKTKTNMVRWSAHNIDYYTSLARSVERQYFREVPFLFQENRADGKTFKSMNDSFDGNAGRSNAVEDHVDCVALMEKVRKSGRSPIFQWFNLPESEMEKCPAYKAGASAAVRADFMKLYADSLYGRDDRALFRFAHPSDGTEGSRPDLQIQPSVHLFPQYDIQPQ